MDIFAEVLSKIDRNSKGATYIPLSEYNIFDVLDIKAKEVVMCRFLADLLSPEGQHGCGILFLKSFLQEILKEYCISDELLAHTDIFREYVIDNDRRIDIVIKNIDFFVPIEVKIYAGEQEGQCYDYFEYAKDAPIIYLTRFGDVPSEYSSMKNFMTAIVHIQV